MWDSGRLGTPKVVLCRLEGEAVGSVGQDACLLGGHQPGPRSWGGLVCLVGSESSRAVSLQEWGRAGVLETPSEPASERTPPSLVEAAVTGVPCSSCPAVASVEILLHFQRDGGISRGKRK